MLSPGISTMLSKPPDQKCEAASLLTTAPLARTTKILPLSASRVGPPALRKYVATVLPGCWMKDPWLYTSPTTFTTMGRLGTKN